MYMFWSARRETSTGGPSRLGACTKLSHKQCSSIYWSISQKTSHHLLNLKLSFTTICREWLGGYPDRCAKTIAGRVRKFPKSQLQVHDNPTIPLTYHHHVSVDTQRPKCGPLQAGLPEVCLMLPTAAPQAQLTTLQQLRRRRWSCYSQHRRLPHNRPDRSDLARTLWPQQDCHKSPAENDPDLRCGHNTARA